MQDPTISLYVEVKNPLTGLPMKFVRDPRHKVQFVDPFLKYKSEMEKAMIDSKKCIFNGNML